MGLEKNYTELDILYRTHGQKLTQSIVLELEIQIKRAISIPIFRISYTKI